MRNTVAVLTLAVWVAAAGSAAALTYELNRPLTVRATKSAREAAFATAPAAEQPLQAKRFPMLQLPTVTIVGRATHRAALDRSPPRATDISQMNCRDWRELQAGSGRVQVCE